MNISTNILSAICEENNDKILYYVRTSDNGVLSSLHQSSRLFLLLTLNESFAEQMIAHFDIAPEQSIISTTNPLGAHAIAMEFDLEGFNIWTPNGETQMVFEKI